MTDKEKIMAHIKILEEPKGNGDYWKGYDSALEDVALFIDSLQKEQKFKVGQYIKQGDTVVQIVEISEMGYHCDNAYVPFTAQDHWELVETKFKVGDTIRVKSMKVYDKTFIGKPAKIVGISSKGYLLDDGNICDFSLQKGWELVEEPDGYGISQEQVDRLINHMKEVKELLKKEEPVSEDLEKAAIEYCGGHKGADARVRAGFIMGANWQKQQMMKDAVETIIDSKPNDYGEFMPIIHVKVGSSYKDGEKVRVIIIKKE